ncbi:hypothetical protein LguiA_008374 [Lonicera macranthoides]
MDTLNHNGEQVIYDKNNEEFIYPSTWFCRSSPIKLVTSISADLHLFIFSINFVFTSEFVSSLNCFSYIANASAVLPVCFRIWDGST